METVIEYFYRWEKEKPNDIFLRQPSAGKWKTLTFLEAGEQARRLVTALQSMGLKVGDHIGLSSKNCMHWFIADLAIMMGGYVSVPFYPSLPKEQFEQIIKLADLKAIFLGRHDQWDDKSDAIAEHLPTILFPHYEGDAKIEHGQQWQTILETNTPYSGEFIPSLDDLWTILFTSGTTGSPKGVMLPHRNPALMMKTERETNWIGMYTVEKQRFFSFLPLNHVAERLGVEVPAIVGGGEVSFAENLASFADNIRDSRPTFIFAVPRIWTLFYQGVVDKVPERKLKLLLKLPILGKRVRQKILSEMGFDNLKIAATGAAITPAFIKDFYRSLGIHLIEAYGMTEVSGGITNGVDLDTPSDSVGRAMPGAEIRIDQGSGEILMRTPYMMTGYYKAQDQTKKVLKNEWLHSGDIGKLDERGYLYVTGRIKDAFKTSKGSFVTPNPLEEFIAANEYIEQVCVAGIGIPQPIALINLSEAGLNTDRQIVSDSINATIDQLNPSRAKHERISTAIIQTENWSADNGILTPTLKVKRNALDQQFSKDYLTWHESDEKVIWA